MGALHCLAFEGILESDLFVGVHSAAAKSLDRIALNFAVIHRSVSCIFRYHVGKRRCDFAVIHILILCIFRHHVGKEALGSRINSQNASSLCLFRHHVWKRCCDFALTSPDVYVSPQVIHSTSRPALSRELRLPILAIPRILTLTTKSGIAHAYFMF